MMNEALLASLLLLPPGSGGSLAPSPPGPQLENLAALAGDWALLDSAGTPTDLRARYAVVAGGAAVMGTLFLGTAEETVTLYHREGSRVTATQLSARGGPLRFAAATAADPGLMRFVVADAGPGAAGLSELRLLRRDDEHLRVEWVLAGDAGEVEPRTFELRRMTGLEDLAAEVASLRASLDALQRELDLRLQRRVRVQRKGEPTRELLETVVFPLGSGWSVVGVPFRTFLHEQTRRYATTYAAEGDKGTTIGHYAFQAGPGCRLRFSVLGGHGYVAVVEETRAPPRRISDLAAFSQKLLAGSYGPVVERIVGGHWKEHPRAVEWDLARFEGKTMRLYVVDVETNHFGQVAVSDISILEDAPR